MENDTSLDSPPSISLHFLSFDCSFYLEYRNLFALVDDSAVHGVRGRQVDDLAQHHAVVHLLVHVGAVLGQLQFVGDVRVVSQGVVHPVSEGHLLLVEDHVLGPELPLDLLGLRVVLLGRPEGRGDVICLETLAQLEQVELHTNLSLFLLLG